MPIAITRPCSPAIRQCRLTHLEREPIDPDRAGRQHRSYCAALEQAGCRVISLPEEPDLPDAVFVEDCAVVVDELAVITRPGAVSRRAETGSVRKALARFRPVDSIEAPGTLDGGDVLRIGRRIRVGRSSRTDVHGIRQLERLLAPHGYLLEVLEVRRSLHLKTAVTCVGPETVLLNPVMVDRAAFDGCRVLEVDPREPMAANALLVGNTVIYPEAFPRTRARMEQAGIRVRTVSVDELAKAEGGVTCCSILLERSGSVAYRLPDESDHGSQGGQSQ